MARTSTIIKEVVSSLNSKKVSTNPSTFSVAGVGNSVGFLYENIRNFIDYKEEHLLRRNAIERILKRKLLIQGELGEGEGVVKELIWAQYLNNDSVTLSQVDQVNRTLIKYSHLLKAHSSKIKEEKFKGWIIGVMSAEVDEMLAPQRVQETLVRAMFRFVSQKVDLPGLKDSEKEVQIFLAVRKVLFKEDIPTLRFHLLLTYFPQWLKAPPDLVEQFSNHAGLVHQKIEAQIVSPINAKLVKILRQFAPSFLILKDVIDNNDNFDKLIENETEFKQAIEKACERRYSHAKKKLGRSIFRSTVYILVTKMMLAYIIEMPLDLLLYGRVSLFPLAVNIIFPPVLMYAVGSSIKVPGKRNTERISKMISEISYGSSDADSPLITPLAVKTNYLTRVFAAIYIFGFAVSFGLMIILLRRLDFGLVSGALFLFFLSVVSFFAYRIRLSAQEFRVDYSREGLTSALIDFFTLPFLQVGQWLSTKFAQINIFMFILDFIIEAPFKAFIEIAENWIEFIKQKKEEII
jgi:hypothetical protein